LISDHHYRFFPAPIEWKELGTQENQIWRSEVRNLQKIWEEKVELGK
jgi:hypothetical protein